MHRTRAEEGGLDDEGEQSGTEAEGDWWKKNCESPQEGQERSDMLFRVVCFSLSALSSDTRPTYARRDSRPVVHR